MSTAANLTIVSVAPGPKRRTFLLQLSRPLTNGEAAELNVRAENPDFSGLGESTLRVASQDNSILVIGEMSADKLEAQIPDLERPVPPGQRMCGVYRVSSDSPLFGHVLGHCGDTGERVFVNAASGHAPPPAHPCLCPASGAQSMERAHTVSDVHPVCL